MGALKELTEHAGPIGSAVHELYLAILREGGQVRASGLSPDDTPVLERLLQLGLVDTRVEDAAYAAVNPRTAGSRISAELRAAGVRLLGKADEVPVLLGDLTRAYDAAPRRPDRTGVVEHVQDFTKIRHRIAQLDTACSEELRAGSPVPCPERTAQADARLRPAGGGDPAGADGSAAASIEDSAVVGFLVACFERDRERAQRVQWGGPTPERGPYSVHAAIAHLLSQGLTRRSIAGRLGLGERTVAGHISRLREEHDAETLFQLGWQMRGARDGAGE